MPPLDHVTALAPRADLEAALARLTADAGPLALAICDVMGLKAVNERDGFLAGDAVLAAAAVRLRRAASAATLVARLGGDELVAVFTGRAAGTSATAAAADLAAPGAPRLRSAAVTARPGEQPGPLLERLYAALRGR